MIDFASGLAGGATFYHFRVGLAGGDDDVRRNKQHDVETTRPSNDTVRRVGGAVGCTRGSLAYHIGSP